MKITKKILIYTRDSAKQANLWVKCKLKKGREKGETTVHTFTITIPLSAKGEKKGTAWCEVRTRVSCFLAPL